MENAYANVPGDSSARENELRGHAVVVLMGAGIVAGSRLYSVR